ncbi:hypothetical protein Dimus_037280, partial [Dionaea muscipula]
MHILAGLGSEYLSFIVSITSRSQPVSLEELHGLLLAHEHRIERLYSAQEGSVMVTNFASNQNKFKGKSQKRFNPNYNWNSQNSNQIQQGNKVGGNNFNNSGAPKP